MVCVICFNLVVEKAGTGIDSFCGNSNAFLERKLLSFDILSFVTLRFSLSVLLCSPRKDLLGGRFVFLGSIWLGKDNERIGISCAKNGCPNRSRINGRFAGSFCNILLMKSHACGEIEGGRLNSPLDTSSSVLLTSSLWNGGDPVSIDTIMHPTDQMSDARP